MTSHVTSGSLSRRTLLAAGSALAGATLVGCSNSNASQGDDVTLTVWTWSNEARAALESGVLEAYEEANPGVRIEVQVQPDRDYQTLLTTGLSGSGGPDIAAIRSFGVISSFAETGNLVALDDIVDEWPEFSEQALAGAKNRADGLLYSVPQGMQTAQVFYNKTLFDSLGLQLPTTWDQFLQLCEAIKSSGTTPIVLPGSEAAQIALAGEIIGNARRGAEEFTEAFVNGEVDLTHPDSVASIELMVDLEPFLAENITAVTADEAVTLFATQQAAMYPSGTWQVAAFTNLEVEFEFASFDIPTNTDWPSGPVTVSYADGGWALSTRSEHPEEAEAFVKWLASTEFADLYCNAMGTIPARSGVTLEEEHLAAMYERYQANPSTYLGLAYLRYGNPWGTDVYGAEVQKLWLGETTAEDVAAAVQDGIDAWFDPSDFS